MTAEYDLCVIGGGSAGLVAAAGGATLGARVLLVEKHKLGGDCLNYGCVPSKALIKCARVAQSARTAAAFGVELPAPRVSIPTVMRRVAAVIAAIEPNDSPERFRGLGVEVVFGAGHFVAPDAVEVEGRRVTARRYLIATGSRPAVPPIPGLDRIPYLTNETIFSLAEDVPTLIVIGGGPIGCEMAQSFARLGTRVTLVDIGERILPREDADASAVVLDSLRRDGVDFRLGARPLRVEGVAGDLALVLAADGGEERVAATHLLVAAGRRANVEDLGLDAAGIAAERGRIVADRRLRTTNPNVYVAGDVAGLQQFTHVAEHHAGVVLRNAIFRLPARVQTENIPWCTFTEPELARVGLSEDEARAQGIAHCVYRFPFHDIDRAQAEGKLDGFAKLLTDPGGRLLGATLVGANAGELIAEYGLAIAKRMKAKDLSSVIHVYPTLAQINRRVADQRLKESLTPTAKRWIRRLFGLRGPR